MRAREIDVNSHEQHNHEQHNHEQRRSALAAQDPLPDALCVVESAYGHCDGETHWTRTFGRFDPGGAPYCTMLYEAAGESGEALYVVELMDECPLLGHELESRIPIDGFGWAKLVRFPHDPRLPTLNRVRGMARDLAGSCTVLRYRPRKRCTLLVGKPRSTEAYIAKVFSDDRGALMYDDARTLARAADRGELAFEVARPRQWHAETRSLWQSRLAGEPLRSRLTGVDGEGLASRLGAACASLTRSSLQPSQRIEGRTQFARTRRYVDELVTRLPSCAQDVHALLCKLENVHHHHDSRPLVPIHGAPHPSQWLDDGTRLALVDFDRLGAGHPELDAATFMVEVEYHKATVTSPAIVNEAFVEAYQAVAGPLDSTLLDGYRAHKHMAKALKSMRGIHADAPARVLDSISRAHDCLRGATR